jgi:hypothetical protein
MDIITAFRQQENRNQARRDAARSIAATKHVVAGQVLVNDIGEGSCFVPFPVKFVEKPLMSDGADLAPGQIIQDGFYPQIQGTVVQWELDERPPIQVYYTGATIALSITGYAGQVMYYHYRFEGMAFVNPTDGITSLSDIV